MNNQELLRLIETPELLNQYDVRGKTPLYYAINTANLRAVKMMIDTGQLDITMTNKDELPINTALRLHKYAIYRLLLTQIVRSMDHRDYLIRVLKTGNIRVFRDYLLAFKIYSLAGLEMMISCYATKQHFELLKSHEIHLDYQHCTRFCLCMGKIQCFNYLLSHCYEVDMEFSNLVFNSITLLGIAVQHNYLSSVKRLLKMGADANKPIIKKTGEVIYCREMTDNKEIQAALDIRMN